MLVMSEDVRAGLQEYLRCVARDCTTFQRFLWYAFFAKCLELLFRLGVRPGFAASPYSDSHLTNPR